MAFIVIYDANVLYPNTSREPLINVLDLPGPDDRHVLAAAIKVNAQLGLVPRPPGRWHPRPAPPP
jgi:hypothetical protein